MKLSYTAVFLILISLAIAVESAGFESGHYVLLETKCAPTKCLRYGAFKFISQPKHEEGILHYEWYALNPNEFSASLEIQNFAAGEKKVYSTFGVGFKDHRLLWRFNSKKQRGELYPANQVFGRKQYGGRYCLTELTDIWSIDLRREIEKLSEINQCYEY
jgi:hypothetical protein